MKLYVWRPDGHGIPSFVVEEETLEAATTTVEDYIKREYSTVWWSFADHSLEIFDVGEVMEHDNS